jgi:dinuclear metal center YbgI/SA1388 family protein
MSILLRDCIRAVSDAFPIASAAYTKDAVGLQAGSDSDAAAEKILIAYEITDAVIDEALAAGANLIISYHPLIFPNVTAVTDATRTGRLLRRLIRSNIALYVVHTCFDANPDFGTSRLMADALKLQNITPLVSLEGLLDKIIVFVPKDNLDDVRETMWKAGAGVISRYDECSFGTEGIGTFRGSADTDPAIGTPMSREYVNEVRLEMICERWRTNAVVRAMTKVHPYEEVAYDVIPLANRHPRYGLGSVGELPNPLSVPELLAEVSHVFGSLALKYNTTRHKEIRRIAVVGGSGMEAYSAARNAADAFITADIRYHDFARAESDDLLLIDAGHSETERFIVPALTDAVRSLAIPDEIVIASKHHPNAVNIYS